MSANSERAGTDSALPTGFWVDPHLPRMLQPPAGSVNDGVGLDFSAVAVAMWPPPLPPAHPREALLGPYLEFLDLVRGCFPVDEDLEPSADKGGMAPVYLYPPQHLHVTVATMHRFDAATTGEERTAMAAAFPDLLRRASRRPRWPGAGTRMRFRLKSARLGERAGILLWEETTGALTDIRKCLKEEYGENHMREVLGGIRVGSSPSGDALGGFSVPDIVHSTFVRFGAPVKSDAVEVRERFGRVLVRLPEIFKMVEVEANAVRLACERTPYMHVPCDDVHVLQSVEL